MRATVLLAVVMLSIAWTAPADGQAVDRAWSDLGELDPDRQAVTEIKHIGSGVLYAWVSDGWYGLQCYQKRRFVKAIHRIWNRHYHGNGNVVVYDRADTEVADFGWLGEYDVRGCDD